MYKNWGYGTGIILNFRRSPPHFKIKYVICSEKSESIFTLDPIFTAVNMSHRDMRYWVLFFTGICLMWMSCTEKTTTPIGPKKQEHQSTSPEGLALINSNNCKTCHNKNLTAIGPSYVAIAGKYGNSPEQISALAYKIKNGGTGVWGKQVMTPHPDLDDVDIQKMIRYILSLDSLDDRSGFAPFRGIIKSARENNRQYNRSETMAENHWVNHTTNS